MPPLSLSCKSALALNKYIFNKFEFLVLEEYDLTKFNYPKKEGNDFTKFSGTTYCLVKQKCKTDHTHGILTFNIL
jgi:hypothetical protein